VPAHHLFIETYHMALDLVLRGRVNGRRGSLAQSRWVWVLALLAALLAACATPASRGDHAFETEQYREALDHYEQAMASGERDAQLYFRAAKSAVRLGEFALAERYYSRSLRYGGGEEVARSLAEFYIATSNYAKAVGVLQRLLETTDEPQAIFNNLGAALMYAGIPLDAESYLLIAQQMDPKDPVPYVNLGVLYDQHLHQPRLAIGFYRCFLELSPPNTQHRKIQATVSALSNRVGGDLDDRFKVPCGEPYGAPSSPKEIDLSEEIPDDEEGEPQAPAEADDDGDEPQGEARPADTDEPAEQEQGDEQEEGPPPVINRQVEELPAQSSDETEVDADEAMSLAQNAWEAHNYGEVIRHLEGVPASALDAGAMALLGRALAATGEFQRAQRWLAGAVEDEPKPEHVDALLEVYEQLDETERIERLCGRFEGQAEFEQALEGCSQHSR
jgi:tetratricopeptide (TPR) repeat protein